MNIQAHVLQPAQPSPGLALPFVTSPRPQAGFPSPATDYLEERLDLHALLVGNPIATFYLRAEGDSMVDARIHDGDILIVDRSVKAQHGHVVVAVSQVEPDRLYVKQLGRIDGKPALVSQNKQRAEKYPPIFLEAHPFEVWGVVIGVARQLHHVRPR